MKPFLVYLLLQQISTDAGFPYKPHASMFVRDYTSKEACLEENGKIKSILEKHRGIDYLTHPGIPSMAGVAKYRVRVIHIECEEVK